MPPALIVAGISAAATIGGAVLSNKSANRAADRAADTQLQVAQQNNALTREFRTENTANFAPNMQSGFRANALYDSFLYGPQGTTAPGPAPSLPVNGPGGNVGSYGQGSVPSPVSDSYGVGDSLNGMTAFSPRGARNLGVMAGQQGQMQTTAPTVPMAAQPGAVTAGQPNALGGYDAFVASPYYQNPLAEGQRQLQHALAAGGMLESGDAIKRAIRYGQDYGAGRQDEFLGLVNNQINRGVQGAGAIAGVNLNALTNQSNNNQNAADAASNAALLRGQNNAAMFNQFGNALGGLAGSFGSSYKGF